MVRRVGKKVILEPADAWSDDFLGCLGAWKEDIPRPAAGRSAARRTPSILMRYLWTPTASATPCAGKATSPRGSEAKAFRALHECHHPCRTSIRR